MPKFFSKLTPPRFIASPRPAFSHRFDILLELAGLGLFLATVEMLIPKPMPFLKLGLANLPILLFVRQLRYRELLLLLGLKVLCQGLISGTILSYIAVFSACASFASGSAMWLLARFPARYFSLLGISLLGAASSNTVQLFLALKYFFPGMASLLIPWSLSFGLGSGFLLGSFALQFCRSSDWYREILRHLDADLGTDLDRGQGTCASRQRSRSENIALLRFIFGLLSLVFMFSINELEPLYLGLELLLFVLLNYYLGYRPWWRSMLLLLLLILLSHALLPTGRVLWEWSPYFRLTLGALERGLGKAFLLLNLIQISRCAVSRQLQLPGRFGHIVQIVFSNYEALLNCPEKLQGLQPVASLDRVLCSVRHAPEQAARRGVSPPPPTDIENRAVPLLYWALVLQVALLVLANSWPLYRILAR